MLFSIYDLHGPTFLGMRMTDFPHDILRYWLARLSVLVLLQCFCLGESAQFDGPAELPRVYVHSALSDTSASGKRTGVREGDDLQAAINNATCGDTLELQAGSVFTGVFRFPEKACDDAHWIVVRTSAPDWPKLSSTSNPGSGPCFFSRGRTTTGLSDWKSRALRDP